MRGRVPLPGSAASMSACPNQVQSGRRSLGSAQLQYIFNSKVLKRGNALVRIKADADEMAEICGGART